MAFPVEISNTCFIDSGVAGPFIFGPSRYASLEDINGNLRVFKSIDSGATWVEMDAIHSPVVSLSFPPASCLAGSVIAVAATEPTGNHPAVYIFSLASDTWGSTTISALGLQATTPNVISVCYRAVDNKILVGAQLTAGVGTTRANYFTFDLAALIFSAWIPIGNVPALGEQWITVALLRGLARTVAYLESLGPTRSIYQQAIPDVGGLAALSLIDTVADAGFSIAYAGAGSNATEIAIAWSRTSLPAANTIQVYQASIIDNDVLVFASQTLSIAAADNISSACVAVGSQGTFFFVGSYSAGGDPPSTIQQALDAGAGFGPLTTLGIENTVSSDDLFAGSLGVGNVGLIVAGTFPILAAIYWEIGAPAPPPAVPVVPIPLQFTVLSFPVSFDCCCPEDVACVRPSKDGKLYAFSKGPLKIDA